MPVTALRAPKLTFRPLIVPVVLAVITPPVVTVRPVEAIASVAPARPREMAPTLAVPILIWEVPEVLVPVSILILPAVLVVPVALPVAIVTLLELVEAVPVAGVWRLRPAKP